MINMFNLFITQIPGRRPEIVSWCLDFPKSGVLGAGGEVLKNGFFFQGWVLTNKNLRAIPYVKHGGDKKYLSLNKDRVDVIERVGKSKQLCRAQYKCGFGEKIPINSPGGVFGFEIQGRGYDVIKFSIEGDLKVLEGKAGWLFLDNDSNNSVLQFKGELGLSEKQKYAWRSYLTSFGSLATSNNFGHAVLIAPSKEMVIPEYYPYKRGKITPVDEVEAISKNEHNLIHPVSQLKDFCKRPFRVCDSHWTPKGARCSFMEILKILKLDEQIVYSLFESDEYKEYLLCGDLGNKIFPPRSAYEELLLRVNYRKHVSYDNHLPNMGRIIVAHNENSLYRKKIIIFGSSSSYTMLDYVCRVFTDVIFVHSAGNIDRSVIQAENPNFVVAQTNGRFVIKPPSTEFDLLQEVKRKWAELDMKAKENILKNQGKRLAQKVGFSTYFDRINKEYHLCSS
ncbi:hypothetical protein MO867_09005 [Microbulbifer sp. OS29]|uniref:Uncharacterized protein n=1 Tax=Microbulbifer okhotskensis TaxID=2926617 RepID=A0A9X2ERN7_9GAMM|nr:hypothetical protein [Microbulbifer okhotskensis]MCO1334478.1 hypothetical protein [Microbulbifer okhotskensis]